MSKIKIELSSGMKEKIYVVCYNCRKPILKSEAFYLNYYDSYYCESCYLKLLAGEPVRVSNWKTRGV